VSGDDDDLLRMPLDDAPGPAQPIDAARAEAIVAAAIAKHAETRVVSIRRRPRRAWVYALAAALALLAFGALAAIVRHARVAEPAPPPIASVAIAATAPVATQPPVLDPAAPAIATTEPTTAAAPVVSAPVEPPADLLRAANELRSHRKWSEASATYERVLARDPHGSEGYTATVAAASLRLEHLNDARGALKLYRAALAERPNGTLAEESRWGVAEAERALGDHTAEIKALHDFLDHHPDALMGGTAKARLRDLESK
jgi:hypothetical protein